MSSCANKNFKRLLSSESKTSVILTTMSWGLNQMVHCLPLCLSGISPNCWLHVLEFNSEKKRRQLQQEPSHSKWIFVATFWIGDVCPDHKIVSLTFLLFGTEDFGLIFDSVPDKFLIMTHILISLPFHHLKSQVFESSLNCFDTHLLTQLLFCFELVLAPLFVVIVLTQLCFVLLMKHFWWFIKLMLI